MSGHPNLATGSTVGGTAGGVGSSVPSSTVGSVASGSSTMSTSSNKNPNASRLVALKKRMVAMYGTSLLTSSVINNATAAAAAAATAAATSNATNIGSTNASSVSGTVLSSDRKPVSGMATGAGPTGASSTGPGSQGGSGAGGSASGGVAGANASVIDSIRFEDLTSREDDLMRELDKAIDRIKTARTEAQNNGTIPDSLNLTSTPAHTLPKLHCEDCGNDNINFTLADPLRGDTICMGVNGTGCGTVIVDHMIHEGSAHRNYEGEEDRNHFGPAPNKLMPDTVNMETSLNVFTAGANTQNKANFKRLAYTQQRLEMDLSKIGNEDRHTREGYKTQQKRKAFALMEEIGGNLNIHQCVINRAKEEFGVYRDNREAVHKFEGVVLACIAIAYEELSDAFQVDEVTKIYQEGFGLDAVLKKQREIDEARRERKRLQVVDDPALTVLPEVVIGRFNLEQVQTWLSALPLSILHQFEREERQRREDMCAERNLQKFSRRERARVLRMEMNFDGGDAEIGSAAPLSSDDGDYHTPPLSVKQESNVKDEPNATDEQTVDEKSSTIDPSIIKDDKERKRQKERERRCKKRLEKLEQENNLIRQQQENERRDKDIEKRKTFWMVQRQKWQAETQFMEDEPLDRIYEMYESDYMSDECSDTEELEVVEKQIETLTSSGNATLQNEIEKLNEKRMGLIDRRRNKQTMREAELKETLHAEWERVRLWKEDLNLLMSSMPHFVERIVTTVSNMMSTPRTQRSIIDSKQRREISQSSMFASTTVSSRMRAARASASRQPVNQASDADNLPGKHLLRVNLPEVFAAEIQSQSSPATRDNTIPSVQTLLKALELIKEAIRRRSQHDLSKAEQDRLKAMQLRRLRTEDAIDPPLKKAAVSVPVAPPPSETENKETEVLEFVDIDLESMLGGPVTLKQKVVPVTNRPTVPTPVVPAPVSTAAADSKLDNKPRPRLKFMIN